MNPNVRLLVGLAGLSVGQTSFRIIERQRKNLCKTGLRLENASYVSIVSNVIFQTRSNRSLDA